MNRGHYSLKAGRAYLISPSIVLAVILAAGCTTQGDGRVRHKITGELLKKENPCICGWPGMMLLRMEVYQGDELVLKTLFDSPDCRGPDYFWEKASRKPFSSDEKADKITANKDNPLKTTIAGAVTIRIVHVNSVKTKATLETLALVRDSPDSHSWYLAKDEIQRVKKAAGL